MKVTVERNTADDSYGRSYPYIARVEIVSATMNAGTVYQIPVFVEYTGLQKTFGVDVCGFRVTAKHPQQLIEPLTRLLHALVNAARLPSYVFIARRARAVFPVYTIDNEVMAITKNGPYFKHVELAKVREYLTDFLHQVGILGEKGLSDKLHVRGISQSTLGLRRPIFYLKKRVIGQTDFWAPVFQAADGKTIFTYAVNQRRAVPKANGMEVLDLWELVAEKLIADGRLQTKFDLRPDRLYATHWEEMKGHLYEERPLLIDQTEMPRFRDGLHWLALETRPDEERFGLFLGRSAEDLAARIKLDFHRRGLLGEHD
ncbi:MAG: hypothetical protein WAS33_24650 [Candidatus Promineifilaceae bacterium]|nr:hypothetical protein [Anaerolineaceae bacterium]